MKGTDLKNKIFDIDLIDGKHTVIFDMNTLCELEDIYGDINSALDNFKNKPIQALRAFIYAFLKAEAPKITIAEAGSKIDMASMENLVKAIAEALSDAMPQPEIVEDPADKAEDPAEKTDGELPNLQSNTN